MTAGTTTSSPSTLASGRITPDKLALHNVPTRRQKHLIFVNRYYYPDISATAQLLTDLAKSCADNGYDVHVITSRQRYEDAAAQLAAQADNDGVSIHRVWSSAFGRRNLAGRMIDYVSFHFAATLAVWRYARPNDIIIAATDPPLLSVAIAPFAWLRKAKLVNWLHDLFPEIAQEIGLGRHPVFRPLHHAVRWFRDCSLHGAVLNVVLGSLMKERLIAHDIQPERIRVIHNWSDDQSVLPIPKQDNKLRRDWRFGLDEFVVGYSGNLGRAHEIHSLLSAIQHFDSAVDDTAKRIRFLIIGGGVLFEDLSRKAASLGLRNVVFKPHQSRDVLSHSLSAADLHLTILRPSLEGLIVPSKLYGIAAAGRPIIHIGDPCGEIAQLLTAGDCGLAVSEGDSRGLIKAIRRIAEDNALCAAMGSRARRLVNRELNQEASLNAWHQAFQSLS